jgi:hypothetical protein
MMMSSSDPKSSAYVHVGLLIPTCRLSSVLLTNHFHHALGKSYFMKLLVKKNVSKTSCLRGWAGTGAVSGPGFE